MTPEELIRRLTQRALARNEGKIADPASFLAGVDVGPPGVGFIREPHLLHRARQEQPAGP